MAKKRRFTEKEIEEALSKTAAEYQREVPEIVTNDDGVPQVTSEDPATLFKLFGVTRQNTGNGLLVSALNALGRSGAPYHQFVVELHAELNPRDAIEAMLIIQMGATHVAMTSLSQKMQDQTMSTIRESLERSMTRLSRTYLAQMDALKKHRAKAQQTVRVERVTVNDGGQAIVGDVTHAGAGDENCR